MIPSQRIKKKAYGRQQNNMLTNILIDIPPAIEEASKMEPQLSYQDGDLRSNSQDHMISSLLAGMDKNSHKRVNYNKIKEVTQDPDENPSLCLNCLMETTIKLII
jgi:hypothetical protein